MTNNYVFRGKRLDNGEWVYGDLVHSESGFAFIKDPAICNYGLWENGHYIGNHFVDKVDPSTVGQYTGFTGKNDKKIFAGDVVFIPAWEEITDVYWSEGAWLLRFSDSDEFLSEVAKDCEVIGNIHDNPELMGDDEEEKDDQ